MNNNKPISVILDDFKNELVKVINDSQLPLCLVKPIIKEIYDEVSVVANQQLQQDRQAWEAEARTLDASFKGPEPAPAEKMEGETEL